MSVATQSPGQSLTYGISRLNQRRWRQMRVTHGHLRVVMAQQRCTSYKERPEFTKETGKECRKSCMRTSASPARRRAASQLANSVAHGRRVRGLKNTQRHVWLTLHPATPPSPHRTMEYTFSYPIWIRHGQQAPLHIPHAPQRASNTSRLRAPVSSNKRIICPICGCGERSSSANKRCTSSGDKYRSRASRSSNSGTLAQGLFFPASEWRYIHLI